MAVLEGAVAEEFEMVLCGGEPIVSFTAGVMKKLDKLVILLLAEIKGVVLEERPITGEFGIEKFLLELTLLGEFGLDFFNFCLT